MDLAKLERESDERNRQRVEEQIKQDVKNFDAERQANHLPYDEPNLLFEQIGNRIRWKSRGERYYSRRFYPSEECAKEVFEIMKGLRK